MHVARPTHEIVGFVQLIDEAYDKRAWHGTNLRGSIRRLSAEQAAWRAGPRRHSILDIVVHCAYWKYAVRRRLRGDPRGSFPLKGSDWFDLPARPGEREWKWYVALLDAEHHALRAAVAGLSPRRLGEAAAGSKVGNRMLIRGAAMHDIYHAGQIQVIKGLRKGRAKARGG